MAQSATQREAKKPWTGAFEVVQEQVKTVEKLWVDTVEQLHTRVQGVEEDARDFVKRVESDGRDRIGDIKEKVGGIRPGGELLEQGAKFRQETVERIGLATALEFTTLASKVDRLATRLDTVRRKANTVTEAKKQVADLKKRTVALEKKLEKVTAELAKLKKAPAAKAPAKKAVAKKAVAKKAVAKNAVAKKATKKAAKK
ncbi:MAG: hypothetical protein VYE15_04150 [Myxococcota bacterium]|nr:hypothetical protein [Myxococcota bacterium]